MGVLVTPNKKHRDEWDIKCDAETLIKAEEIKADPDRLKDAMELVQQGKEALDKLTNKKYLAQIGLGK